MAASSHAHDQFVALLREMFQIQDLDLDFGIYRVLNQERTLIEAFLNERLAPLTRKALGAADNTQRAALETELQSLSKTLEDAGVPLESSKKYVSLQEQLETLGTSDALENDVYNGLADFFARYYDKGDFLSRPRYRKDVYALPYNGEEVKLHWANRDQYYIKSAQVLDTFEWKLNDLRVRFQLREAGTAENNNKEERRFVLALDEDEKPVVSLEGDESGDVLTIFFDFKKTVGGPRDTNVDAEKRLMELLSILGSNTDSPRDFAKVKGALETILAPWPMNDKKSHFLHRLNGWTARGSFDFFVHKDLKGFLSRELSFFLKNEVVSLDALFAGDQGAWEKTTLAKAQAMHTLGTQIIEFLASLEELQKRLWEKQKWVTQSRAVLPLEKIPASLLPDVLNNAAQTDEWKELYKVQDEPVSTENLVAWSEPPSAQWAQSHGDIAVDTTHFPVAWTQRLWSELSVEYSLDDLWNGVLWNGDNFAALNLMQKRFAEQIKCIYIDPPYNTGGDGFLYKDSYQHSSWLSMMQDRLELSRPLMSDDGAIFVSIDENENQNLRWSLENAFGGNGLQETIIVRANSRGQTYREIAKTHEYIQVSLKDADAAFSGLEKQGDQNDLNLKDEIGAFNLREIRNRNPKFGKHNRPNLFYPIFVNTAAVDENGLSPVSLIESAEYFVQVLPLNSTDGESCWRWGQDLLKKNAISNTMRSNAVAKKKADGSFGIYEKYRKTTFKPKSIWDENVFLTETGTLQLKELGLSQSFNFPKPIDLIGRCAELSTDFDSLVLDYFAGSGTTGHAVLNLNRADGENGKRRFLLVEMGRYFDTVLVPRLKKAAFADKWRDGAPIEYSNRQSVAQTLFIYRLETYEDALEHLAAVVRKEGQMQIEAPDDAWTVRYALSTNTRDGELPLSDELFRSPFKVQMRVGGDDIGSAQAVTVDAVATFNWLLGLRVHKMWFPTDDKGETTLAAVCGLTPDNRAVVVVWRHLQDETFEDADQSLLLFWQNDAVLQSWRADFEVQTVYINGDSTLWRSRTQGESWTQEPLEATFRELMFATAPRREVI